MARNWFDEILDIKGSKLFALTCGVSFLGSLSYALISGESISYSIFLGVASSLSMAAFLWCAIMISPVIFLPVAALIGILKPYLRKLLRWLQESF